MFAQNSLVSSIVQSFIMTIVTRAVSMVLCVPAACFIARFKYRGRKIFMLSFLLTNAFPKPGIYTSIWLNIPSAALSVIMFLICSVSAGVYIYTNLKENEWEK